MSFPPGLPRGLLNQPNGVAGLDGNGLLPNTNLPTVMDLTASTFLSPYGSESFTLRQLLSGIIHLCEMPGYSVSDVSIAFAAAITVANSLFAPGGTRSAGQPVTIMVPPGVLQYGTGAGVLPDILCNLIIQGAGSCRSQIIISNAVATPALAIFTWAGSNTYASDLHTGTGPVANPFLGAGARGLTFIGNHTGATTPINILGTVGYLRIGQWWDLDFYSIPGQPIIMGTLPAYYAAAPYNFTISGFHEWTFFHVRVNDCGTGAFTGSTPGKCISVYGTGTNSDNLRLIYVRVFSPQGDGFEIRGALNGSSVAGSVIDIDGAFIHCEGSQTGGAPYLGTLLKIGDASDPANVGIPNLRGKITNAYPGYQGISVDGATGQECSNYNLDFDFAHSPPTTSAYDIWLGGAKNGYITGRAWSAAGTSGKANIHATAACLNFEYDDRGANITVEVATGFAGTITRATKVTSTDGINFSGGSSTVSLANVSVPETDNITAAGTSLATATILTSFENFVTAATGGKLVALPNLTVVGVGQSVWVYARAGAAISVLPDVASHTIEGATGVYSVADGASIKFVRETSTGWRKAISS
jgi:hypothetical protein